MTAALKEVKAPAQTLEVTMIPFGAINSMLPAIAGHIQTAADLTAGRCSADDILRFLVNGRYVLWVVYDTGKHTIHGFFATEMVQYPQIRMLSVQHCVVEPHLLEKIEARIEELSARYAKENQCAGIEFTGRPGWKPYAKRKRFHSHNVVYQHFFDKEAV